MDKTAAAACLRQRRAWGGKGKEYTLDEGDSVVRLPGTREPPPSLASEKRARGVASRPREPFPEGKAAPSSGRGT